MMRIDQKVNKAIKLFKSCQSTTLKNIKRLFQKENHYETLICLRVKNDYCEKTKKVA
jgi:hypothetical protein